MSRLRPMMGWAIVLLAIVVGAGAAFNVFVLAARVTSSIPILIAAAALALVIGAALINRLAARQIAPRDWQRATIMLTVFAFLVVAIVAAVTVFRPFDLPYQPEVATPETRYWDLPTGSRIAYIYTPATGSPKQATPVIYVHGGIGVPGELGGQPLARLAQDGFDVYHYDQFGCGLSSRSPDLSQYTVGRQVADLDAIRQRIGAERVILVAHSWGSVLAAQYMVAHPERVARVVFVSPAPLTWSSSRSYTDAQAAARVPASKTRLLNAFITSPRYQIWYLVYNMNPEAAYNFAGDREMDGVFETAIHAQLTGRCDPTLSDPVSGVGYYVYLATTADWKHMPDLHPALAVNHTPALILRGSCDFITWQVAADYRQTLPNETLLYVKDAGHLLSLDQPEVYVSAIRAFLLDQPLPLPPYTENTPPVSLKP